MIFLIWMIVIFIVSIFWAYYSLKRERQRHELEKAKTEMSSGRVIFHSASANENEDKS
jgi:hypothetical protein